MTQGKRPKTPGSGRNFQPGNTYGRISKPNPMVTVLRAHNRESVQRVFNEAITMKRSELKQKLATEDLTVLENAIYSICEQSIVEADPTRLNFILDRLIGKPKEEPPPLEVELKRIPTKELAAMAMEAIERLNSGEMNHAIEDRLIEQDSREEHQD